MLGQINRANGLNPAVTVPASGYAWYQYTFTVPATFNGATNYIIFKGITHWGNDIYLDDVQVVGLTPCIGTPTAGATSASPNPVCPNVAFTLSAPSATVAGGINYQWQSGTSATGPWTNIAGATTVPYVVSAGISTTTYYRLRVTCTSTGLVDSSTVITETLNSPSSCYCIPTYASGGSADYITNVTLGTLSNNTNAYGNPSPYYVNYTSQQPSPIAIPTLLGGNTYIASVSFGADGSQYSAIWIDFNQDGTFSSSEYFTTGTNAGSGGTANISITVPGSALPGQTRMRIRGADDSQPSSTQACGASNSSYGEAEDYLVNILPQTPAPPTLVNNSPLCPGSTLTITATIPAGYTSPTYTLRGPGIVTPITNSTGIFSIPNVTAANNGIDSVTVTAGGFTSAYATTNVVIYPTPTLTVGTIISPTTCGSSTGSIQINGMPANTTVYLTLS